MEATPGNSIFDFETCFFTQLAIVKFPRKRRIWLDRPVLFVHGFLAKAAHDCLAFGAACAWFASGAIATSRRHRAVWRVLRRVNLQQVRNTKVRAHNWGEAGQGGKRNQHFSEAAAQPSPEQCREKQRGQSR